MYIKKILKVSFLLFFVQNCSEEKNYGSCTEEKKDIKVVPTKDEMIEIENASYSSSCTILTYEEDSQLFISNAAKSSSQTDKVGYYSKAADILEKLIEFEPTIYRRYSVLSATYAGIAGVELLSFLTSFAQNGSGSSIFDLGKENFPSPSDANYTLVRENLTAAVEWIDAKIAAVGNNQADGFQSASYKMALTLVIANGILEQTSNGQWTEESLNNLSIEDVDAIVDNLSSIAATLPPEIAGSVAEFENSNQLSDAEKKELLKNAILNK